jgi:hypothetical protein
MRIVEQNVSAGARPLFDLEEWHLLGAGLLRAWPNRGIP